MGDPPEEFGPNMIAAAPGGKSPRDLRACERARD
jgi:hypothetical protein